VEICGCYCTQCSNAEPLLTCTDDLRTDSLGSITLQERTTERRGEHASTSMLVTGDGSIDSAGGSDAAPPVADSPEGHLPTDQATLARCALASLPTSVCNLICNDAKIHKSLTAVRGAQNNCALLFLTENLRHLYTECAKKVAPGLS